MLLALGIAAVVRHTAGAIGGYVFVMLVLPIIVAGLPRSVGNDIERFLPMSVGSVMMNNSVPRAFGPWTEFIVLCGYAVLGLALGTVLLVRRDAWQDGQSLAKARAGRSAHVDPAEGALDGFLPVRVARLALPAGPGRLPAPVLVPVLDQLAG
jgi:hypothetical protein